jgi:energy-coupling factor transporter ATP-binding protein EcfA2
MPKPVYRVALVGAAGAGKTSQAKMLQAALGGDTRSFAAPLKKILRDIFGDLMNDPVFYRDALQQFGTDFVRKRDVNAWVRMFEKNLPVTRSIYVDDCRFHNEYQALERLGFYFIRLSASPEEFKRRRPTMTIAQAQHESELESAQFKVNDYIRTDPQRIYFEEVAEGGPEFRMETQEESMQRTHAAILELVLKNAVPVAA